MNCAINGSGPDPLQLLRQLGLQPNAFQQQLGQSLPRPTRSLQALFDQFMRAGGGESEGGLFDGPIAPQGFMGPPPAGGCGCRGFASSTLDLGAGSGQNRRDAGMIEQLLQSNPQIRAQMEAALGGKILGDGLADGVLRVQRQPMGMGMGNNAPLGPVANSMSYLDGIDRGALQAAGPQAMNDPFMGMMTGALANTLGGGGAGGAPAGGAGGALGGDNELGNIMGDPGMTMEDKVVMLLMKICKSFDRQIEQQANKLQALQQQQQGGGGKGGGGKGGGAGGQPSIDVESMNLKRLIDKRGQMFDMLRQVIDKYNQTAKGMIDGIGR